jgi:hypothetical protein
MKRIGVIFLVVIITFSMTMSLYAITDYTTVITFSDVQPGQWFYNDVMTLTDRGIISGVTTPVNGVAKYEPQGAVTLGQFLAIGTRLVAKEYIKDVFGAKHWAMPYYQAAVESGLIDSKDFSSSPEALDSPMNREDMAFILVNITRASGEELGKNLTIANNIGDYDLISDLRKDAVIKVFSNGLIVGDGNGNFNPSKSLTRAEVATVFHRVIDPSMRPAVAIGKHGNTESQAKIINVWSFTNEVPSIIGKYKAIHPSFDYEINNTVVSSLDGAYQIALDLALAAGGQDAPDIYNAETAFALNYTRGEAAGYAATYKELGIDIDRLLKKAEIAQYTVDMGTRTSDNEVVALTYQGTSGACIYRRSIAKDVWGTDDPLLIRNKIGPGWDQFFKAAAQLKAKGYGIVSGYGDIWNAIHGNSPTGWIVEGKLNIDPSREKFLDYAKQIKDNGWSNDTLEWNDNWYADISDSNEQKVLCYFGPAWLINYILDPYSRNEYGDFGSSTYGDWAICEPPASFFWGGSWILANKETKHKEAIGDILEWITLDSSNTGLQYLWANGIVMGGNSAPKDTVPSAAVMKKSNGRLSFLDGQNMFDVFIPANASVSSKNRTDYDEWINMYWFNVVHEYAEGSITRSQAISRFKELIAVNLGID